MKKLDKVINIPSHIRYYNFSSLYKEYINTKRVSGSRVVTFAFLGSILIGFFVVVVFVALGFEPGTSHLQDRHSYHLSHSPSPVFNIIHEVT
jgi:hypothetical protein